MKVLYVIDSFLTGGAETSLLEISSRLTTFKPVVCTIFSERAELKDQFVHRNLKIIELNVTSRFWWVEGVIKLKKIIKEVAPDVIHATLYKAEIIARLAVLNSHVPLIGSFVNDSYAQNRYSQQSFIRNLKLNFLRFIDGITARSVSKFMSISKAISDTNAKALHISSDKIICIYRGRNINNFEISHPSADQSPFIFLTVARLLKRKGYMELFHAVKQLEVKGYPFLVRIAGGGEDYDLFKNTVAKLQIDNKIEFLGNRKDVPDLLCNAHCFVFPSHYEGQGGALIEAMLAAKPIIASDIPVFREQIIPDHTGKLFQLFSEYDLANTMEWMIKNYQSAITLGLNARGVAIERFNIETTVKLHEELYAQVLKGTGTPSHKP